MNVTDPVADMLTRVNNALVRKQDVVDIPSSSLKRGIAKKLLDEGFIIDYKNIRNPRQGTLRLHLKYGPNDESVIQGLKRVSKPGRRRYVGVEEIPLVKSGLGIALLTTPKGVLTGREARAENVGGEFLCEVW